MQDSSKKAEQQHHVYACIAAVQRMAPSEVRHKEQLKCYHLFKEATEQPELLYEDFVLLLEVDSKVKECSSLH